MADTRIISHGKRKPARDEGRKASVPLHVMLEPEEAERYKLLAETMGISMRDLVRMGLDAIARDRAEAQAETDANIRRFIRDDSHTPGHGGLDELEEELGDRGGRAALDELERMRLAANEPAHKMALAQAERLGRLEAFRERVEQWQGNVDQQLDEAIGAINAVCAAVWPKARVAVTRKRIRLG